ncbi:MAG: glutamine-hydrolyzing GMP synthase, partial [Candidatus Sungbacteria bacterium]|nr:glutamine-hydrolyzing GMP synthase [Candidatus Sungbacteria bacterium]
ARRIRELGVRSVVLAPERTSEWLSSHTPRGIILSGGWSSIYDADAPQIPDNILDVPYPKLGICLGMHWMAQKLGGTVEASALCKEYGVRQFFCTTQNDPLFAGIPATSPVLMSHGDSVTYLPQGGRVIGETASCPLAAFSIPEKNIWGIQFHPESSDSAYGINMLENFLAICGADKDWDPASCVDQIRNDIRSALPKRSNIIHLFSGGVDSTVIAAILQPVLGEHLDCVTIDAGNFREGEMSEIYAHACAAHCSLTVIDATHDFLEASAGLTDAEEKRMAFQRIYQKTLDHAKQIFETTYAIQGTLATDLIESGKEGGAALIKTHHNVGVQSLNPLAGMFKDEVRELARFLKLPASVCERMPFPGPGLFVRIVGMPVTQARLDVLRWADGRVREIIKANDIEKDISQLIVTLDGPTTGVKGDARCYGYAVVVRAIQSIDFMTGHGYEIPSCIRRVIIDTLTQHREIVRVWFDETPKPPATFEME